MEVVAIATPGLGDMSYLFTHEAIGVLIDPQRDVDRFLTAAEERDVELRWVLETHLHNDYISGGREAAARSGSELVLPAGSGAAFEHMPAFHGEEFGTDGISIRPLHTPGHTPEHVSYLVVVEGEPVAVFSGGSMLVGAAGRTDLLGRARARQLARLQWGSTRRLAALPESVGLYPTHGAGSFCTAAVAGPSTSTIGAERQSNPALAHSDAESFADDQLSGLEPYPVYYAQMGPINLNGPTPLERGEIAELLPSDLAEILDSVTVVDGRPKAAYAAGHIPGSVGIEANQDFATWVGWLVPFNAPLVLILDSDSDLEEARLGLGRIGFEDVRGWLRGLDQWHFESRPVVSHETVTARGFLEEFDSGADMQVLDVRSPGEWKDGHLADSIHFYLPDLVSSTPTQLDRTMPVYIGCATGHRASTAAGILLERGFRPKVMVGASLLGVLMLLEQRRLAESQA
jgi:glyoxylase-like metal-dependent hydrolase (beta-lactamase superfamily II)/rhodanese-related sulfurtransferase